MIAFAIGIFVGAPVGAFVLALCIVAGRADRATERTSTRVVA